MKMHKIEGDHGRFREIVRGRIRKELRRFLTNGELVGRKGKDAVSIPLPQIDIPRFKFGQKQTGGVGQGDGDVGDSLGQDGEPGQGAEAGDKPGEHILEVDVSLPNSLRSSAKMLELPNIEPKGKNVRADREVALCRHPPHRPGSAAPLQAHVSRPSAAAADRQRRSTTP
jgi:uncharacterized protein